MRIAIGIVVTVLMIGLLSLAGFGPYYARRICLDLVGDKLYWESVRTAGMRSVNCGYVETGHDARNANDCVRAALAAGKAFRVRYGVQSIDAEIDTGLMRSPQGRLYAVTTLYRSELFRQHVRLQECTTELEVTGGGRLACLRDPGF
jgi:hypothetical protein